MDASSLFLVQLHCISFAFLVAYVTVNKINNKKHKLDYNDANMSSDEPPTKKVKSSTEDWKDHKLNIEEAVMKADETSFLSEIVEGDLSLLQGIGPKADKVLQGMGLKTIKDLAGKCRKSSDDASEMIAD